MYGKIIRFHRYFLMKKFFSLRWFSLSGEQPFLNPCFYEKTWFWWNFNFPKEAHLWLEKIGLPPVRVRAKLRYVWQMLHSIDTPWWKSFLCQERAFLKPMFYEKHNFDEILIFPKRHIFGLKKRLSPMRVTA